MKGLLHRLAMAAGAGIVLVILAGILLFGREPGGIDWHEARAVVFESDDWGLCGFLPTAEALDGLDRQQLRAGRFPEVYWGSTLEDSVTVARLSALLAKYEGRDGLPPLIQANYLLSSLAATARSPSPAGSQLELVWRRFDLPSLPPHYERSGLWEAVYSGIERGVWRPELHGSFHYDPDLRRQGAVQNVTAFEAAQRGVPLFPGGARGWELGPWRSLDDLAGELDRSLKIFTSLFGRAPVSIMAPDYVWDGRCEDLWESRGLQVIQAKREQRHPSLRGGSWWSRLGKAVNRTWDRLRHPGRVYLERNCRLEAVQAEDWRRVVDRCHREILAAWERGEPAIVETHRVNFVHLDPAVREVGFKALAALLDLLTADQQGSPLFLTDAEVAQLANSGTSWSLRGDRIVLRNLSHRRAVLRAPEVQRLRGPVNRLLPVPKQEGSRLVSLAPQTTQILTSP